MTEKRHWVLVIGLAALAGYGWLAVRHHGLETRPGSADPGDGAAWIVGPSAPALERAAASRVAESITRLNDRSLAPAERLRTYREELAAAESLLVRSIRARPTDAWTLAQLAAVRWELDPPHDHATMARHLETIERASAMAPHAPRVQMQLGELMLEMGRVDEGLGYYRRAVDLQPVVARRVIETLREHALPAAKILDGLPLVPAVLAALGPAFREDDDEASYLGALEGALFSGEVPPTPRLLASYGDACVRTEDPTRLELGLERLGERDDSDVESERLRQRGRARLTLGDTVLALADLEKARELRPDEAELAVDQGRILEAAGRFVEAVDAYREALGLMARAAAGERARARVYGLIGRVEESQGRPANAYDAYRMALKLDPAERIASRSLARVEAAAGIR